MLEYFVINMKTGVTLLNQESEFLIPASDLLVLILYSTKGRFESDMI